MRDLLSEFFPVKNDAFDHAVVVSIDMTSDIEATNAIEFGAASLPKKAWTDSRAFNPLYLPMSRDDLVKQLELDSDGNLVGIGDFEDPYEAFIFERSEPETNNVFKAKVVYHEFQIPHPTDPSTPYPQRYLS
jgi:hypothetical protein